VPIQIGQPRLPEAGSDAHFEILRCRLDDCAENHNKFNCTEPAAAAAPAPAPAIAITIGEGDSQTLFGRETQPRKSFKLPTRLIDVGDRGSATVPLRDAGRR